MANIVFFFYILEVEVINSSNSMVRFIQPGLNTTYPISDQFNYSQQLRAKITNHYSKEKLNFGQYSRNAYNCANTQVDTLPRGLSGISRI